MRMTAPERSKPRAIKTFDAIATGNVPWSFVKPCKACYACSFPHTGVPETTHPRRPSNAISAGGPHETRRFGVSLARGVAFAIRTRAHARWFVLARRGVRQGRAVWRPAPETQSCLHPGGRAVPGAGHRRRHVCLYARQRDRPADAPRSRAASAVPGNGPHRGRTAAWRVVFDADVRARATSSPPRE